MPSPGARWEAARPAPARTAAALAALALAAAGGWLAAARPELFALDLPASPEALALAALGTAAAVVAVVALLRHPGLATAVLVVFVVLNLSEVLVRGHGLPSLLQLLALPLAVAGLRARGRDGTAAVAASGLTLALGGYLAVVLASTAWAADTGLADERLAEIVKATIVYLLVALLAAGPRRLRAAAWAAVAAGALLAALGVWQALTESFDFDFGGLARIKQAQIYGDVFEPRIAGPLGDPNYFAQILLVLVPLALALAWGEGSWTGRRGRRRALALAAAGLLVAGTVLTYSRGAALALAVVIGVAVVLHGVRPRHVAAAVAAALLLAVLAPAGFTRRLTTLAEIVPGGEQVLEPDSSFAKRRLVTAAAWRMFLDHPEVGVGAGNYAHHFVHYADRVGSDARLYEEPGARNFPHNLYLEVAAETGVLGLAAWGGVLLAAFVTLLAARRRLRAAGDLRTAALGDGVAAGLVGYLVTWLFLHGEFPRYPYLLFGLATALLLTGRTEGEEEAAGPRMAEGEGEAGAAPAGAADGAPAVRVRRPVAVLLSRFPLVTETFILREVDELERQGQPVVLAPLIRERPAVVHREAEPWVGRALSAPWMSAEVLAACGRTLVRRPLRLAATVLRLVAGAAGSPAMLWRSLALVPKSILLSERLPAAGVHHLHAHYATHPATAALVASRLGGLDFSFTVHAHDLFVDRHLLAWKLREARFVRVISEHNRAYIARLYPWAAGKLAVVHVGVAMEEGAAPAPAAVDEEPEPLVLCVAALKEYKGVAVLVDACRRLRDEGVRFRCEVIGDGPLRGELAGRIAAAGLEGVMELAGARRQDEVARRLAAARMVVEPSVVAADGQMEGIPVALMEALAAARPVVASRLSGIPELVVDGETGLLVPPGDAAALAAAIRRLLGDRGLGERLGRAGRERVEREFRLEATTAGLLGVIDRHNPPPEEDGAELARAAADGSTEERAGAAGAAATSGPRAVWTVDRAAGAADADSVEPSGDRPLQDQPPAERASPASQAAGDPSVARLAFFPSPPAGSSSSTVGLAAFHRNPDAEVAEVLLPATTGRPPERRFVKRHLDRPGASRPAAARARREAAVAARVAAWDGAPRPLAVDAAGAVVVFAPCPGEPLDRLLRRLRRRRDGAAELTAAVAAAGRWLARYQATPLADLLGDPMADLSSVAPLGSSASASASVPVHGDLWPGNLRIDDGVARALDFEGAALGPRHDDPAWFLLHLDLYLARPGLGRLRRELADAFLRAWLGDAKPFDRAALARSRAAAARLLLGRSHGATGPRAAFRRALLRRELRRGRAGGIG